MEAEKASAKGVQRSKEGLRRFVLTVRPFALDRTARMLEGSPSSPLLATAATGGAAVGPCRSHGGMKWMLGSPRGQSSIKRMGHRAWRSSTVYRRVYAWSLPSLGHVRGVKADIYLHVDNHSVKSCEGYDALDLPRASAWI